MVEVKASEYASLNPHLEYFRAQIEVSHSVQSAFDADFVDRDSFENERSMFVPAITLLSQLV